MSRVEDRIVTIVVPNYPDKVLIAKARRPKYYLSLDSKLTGNREIPKTFKNPEKYGFDERGILIKLATGEPQLANPQTAGKPRYWVVNFQDIWNGNMAKQDRAMKVDRLKAILRPYIEQLDPITTFPIGIEILIFDTECPVDISNKGVIYTKVIEDLLVNTNKDKENNKHIIPDDSIEYINDSGRTKFVRVRKEEEKRMEVRIFRSNNTSI